MDWSRLRESSALLSCAGRKGLTFLIDEIIEDARDPPRTCPTVRLPLIDFTTNYAKPALRAYSIRVAHPSVNSIGSKLLKRRPQPPTSQNERAGVYVIPYKDCDDRYKGQTDKRLSVRLRQHKDTCRLVYQNNSVFEHNRDKNHAID